MAAAPRSVIDPRLSLGADAAILLAASVIAGSSAHRWSWPLLVWGVAIGVAAVAWAYGSTRAFGARIVRSRPEQGDAIRARAAGLWARQRWTYLTVLVMGVAVGIMAAGTDIAWIDAAFTALWIVAGVLPPLVMYPILRRKALGRPTRH